MERPLTLLCCLVFAASLHLVAALNESQPISIFRTRPELVSQILTVFTRRPELQAPGYYFMSPYMSVQQTLLIYDNNANLIYSGFGSAGPGISHAPQVCQYKNESHLCFYQGTQMLGWGHGHGIIMDKHYRIVKSVEPASYQASGDMHEFQVINNGASALMTQYLRSVQNLCTFGICNGFGYVQEGAFQEVDVESGSKIFEWRSLDHISLNESTILPATTEISGTGIHPESAWDYFHINSIDKDDNGDYLISARHTSALYKISGKDGHVIWRMGGTKSDFTLDGVSFSFQHDARWVTQDASRGVITLFDNASNGFTFDKPHSQGLLIEVNFSTMTVSLIRAYDPPALNGGQHISKSQGNYQSLPGGNVILGWGNDAFWTEYTEQGEVAFYGSIGWADIMNYRVHKFNNWVGLPLTKPALWTYSKTGLPSRGMMAYVSWNGATEVRRWTFYGSDAKDGPWERLGSIPKAGFESEYWHEHTSKYVYVVASDASSMELGRSEVQATFVPEEAMHSYCNDRDCSFAAEAVELEEKLKQEEAIAKEAENQKEDEAKEEVELEFEPSRDDISSVLARNLAAAFGIIGAAMVVILAFASRSFLSAPTRRLRLWLADRIAGQHRGAYKEVPMYRDETTRMSMDPP